MDSSLRRSSGAPRLERQTASYASGQTAYSQDFATLRSRTFSFNGQDGLIGSETRDDLAELTKITPVAPGSAESEKTWAEWAKRLQDQDKETAGAWKEQIDSLLVFAGLFSAILTAFNVDVYKALQPAEGEKPHRSDVWINTLWFASLVLSLSSASIGIVIRQWIVYFLSATPTSGRQDVYVHCLRWDKGIIAWRVPELLALLPVLLQLALTLFFIGLVILLWTLNTDVAIVTTFFVGVVLAFLVFSTVAPVVSPYCPYKSPQALLLHSTAHLAVKACVSVSRILAAGIDSIANLRAVENTPLRWPLQYLSTFVGKPSRMRVSLYRNWASLERSVVSPIDGKNPHHDIMNWIEDNVFARGHVLLMDEVLLEKVIPKCLHDFNEHVDESQANRYALKRLQCIFDGQKEQPLSVSARNELARMAIRMLPEGSFANLDKQYQEQIWQALPYILTGGEDAIVSTIQYMAQQPMITRGDGQSLPSSEYTKEFIEICIKRNGLKQVWNEGPPLRLRNPPLRPEDHDYIVHLIEVILEILDQDSDHAGGEELHRRINACGLAAFLARSLPEAYAQKRMQDHANALLQHAESLRKHAHRSHDDHIKILLYLGFEHLHCLFSTLDDGPQALASYIEHFKELLPRENKRRLFDRVFSRLNPETPKLKI